MAGRIVVFGATGYTGRLTVESLLAEGAKPVLAGRSAERLAELASDLGDGLETQVADTADPSSVRALVEPGDVLVATVGPFLRLGEPAIRAAIDAPATYLDSTGEPAFIRAVFERYGKEAEQAGAGLVTAFGYDFVPGNLAAALALEEAGDAATRVDVGYFLLGPVAGSGGTRASLAGSITEPMMAWRQGRMATERPARRVLSFPVAGSKRAAITISGSEAFALPRLAPRLKDVNVCLGWFGPMARPLQVMSLAGQLVQKIPGARPAIRRLAERVPASTGGPDPDKRARTRSWVVAVARNDQGDRLSQVALEGPNPYSFTGDILAWGAIRAAANGLRGTGALGPVEAFGLEELQAGCADAGMTVATED
jgi:short subunit dehydrogenase-like uncharacterized protein